MVTILALETSSDTASVALLREEAVHTLSTSGFTNHSQAVLPMLQELFKQTGITIQDCDAIAFGCGPGSFTGVRTACGIAQGLAFAADLPVLPIITLHTMAQSCYTETGADNVLTILDARMKEVYWAQYKYNHGEWLTVIEPRLSAASAVLPQGKVTVCGNGLEAYKEVLMGLTSAHTSVEQVSPNAVAVAQLGQAAFLRGERMAARDAQPLYLRNKIAQTTKERLAVKEGIKT